MNSITIPFNQVGKMSAIMQDYLNNIDELEKMIYAPPKLEGFEKKLSEFDFSWEKRERLVQQLTQQYQGCGLDVPENVKQLFNQNAFTITTGHQLCLFGGPQYFIHKIVSVIKLSKQLKDQYPDKEFIPIFWMASEDHDFDEINQVNLFGKKLQTEEKASGPVGRIKPAIFNEALSELERILGDDENGKKLFRLFQSAHSEKDLSTAFRKWVHELFHSYGLVIVDGDDKELKQSFTEVFKDELVKRKTHVSVELTSSILESKGYHTQVTPREINLFYIEDGLRERIVFENSTYRVLNTNISFTEESLLACLKEFPEKFSPNAIMRPLYEEYILPNLAYVGGPGELAYWLQLKSNFDRLSVPFPLLVLRDSFLLTQQKQLDTLESMGVDLKGVFGDLDELIRKYLKSNSGEELNFEREEELLGELKQGLLNKVSKVDGSLEGMVRGEMKGIQKSFEKLEKKLIKAKKQREEVNLNKIRRIKDQWMPGGVLQERSQSFIPNYLKLGDNYIPTLLEYSDAFNSELKLITL